MMKLLDPTVTVEMLLLLVALLLLQLLLLLNENDVDGEEMLSDKTFS